MRVAAMGRTHWLYDSIQAVRQRGHEIVLIATCPAAPEYSRTERDFEALAAEIGCPYFCDARLDRPERLALLTDVAPDVAISVNWLTVIGEDVLNRVPHGVINAHFGDLPRYRGNAVANWAILAGEARAVLTLHEMAPALDAGPILAQRALDLGPETYIADAYAFASAVVAEMFADVIDGLAAGTLTPRPQSADPADSLRCFPRRPSDGHIDWSLPADHLARLVRASAEPFPGAFTYLEDGRRLTVWRARADQLPYPWLGVPGQVAERDRATGEVVVLAGEGVLVLEEVQVEDGPRCRPADLLRSLRTRLGLDLVAVTDALRRRVAELERATPP